MIRISGLNHAIGGKPILEDIDLDISDGEFVAIIGPNGAGKSTLVKLILGLLPLQSGTISIDGIEHARWLRTHRVGYLPQREEYDRRFPATAIDIVLLGQSGELSLGARFAKGHRERALAAMDFTGTADLAHNLIGSLSGGEFQRVLLARAIVGDSRYLFLDEPEAGIDKPGVNSFFTLLRKLNQDGITIITVSHDLNTLSEHCSFLVCLNRRLHCHTATELVNAEVIHKTFGEAVRLIEKDY